MGGGTAIVNGTLTVGDLVAVVALIMMFQMSMHMLAMHINGAFRSKVTAQRLLNVIDTADVVTEAAHTRPMPALTGALRADGLIVDIGSKRVLDGVDIAIAAGESVAVFGPTGSGKSTLLHALARLRDPDGGVVTYDGIDVRDFDPVEIRQHVVCLPQRQWIFEGTLAENIAFARPTATDEDVAHAAEAAGLSHIPLTRRFGRAHWTCRPASGSASAWPASCSSTRTSCCSTTRRPTSTRKPKRRCSTRSSACATAGPW